jgi:hypothetical protein
MTKEFIEGKIYQYEDDKRLLVLCTETGVRPSGNAISELSRSFTGVALTTAVEFYKGEFKDNWNANAFCPYRGIVTPEMRKIVLEYHKKDNLYAD